MYTVTCEVEKLSNDGTIKTTTTTEDYEMDGIIVSMSVVLIEHVVQLTTYCGVGLIELGLIVAAKEVRRSVIEVSAECN